MEKTDGRLAGILGTVIIHLIVGIIVMVFQIRELHVKGNLILDLELFSEYEYENGNNNNNNNNEEFRLPGLSAAASTSNLERVLQGDPELLNIARNLANATDPAISRDDYIDMVKDELIRSGQLGVDNYIDRGRLQASGSNNGNYVPVSNTNTNTAAVAAARNEERTPSGREVSSVNYRGQTRIEYSLEGRFHTYLPNPIYKCQSAGIITLRIEVNQRGDVEKATIVASASVTDPCLIETAINSASGSKFNPDINAPRIQTGMLSFQFVAQ